MTAVTIRKAKPSDAKILCELGNDFLKYLEPSSSLLTLEPLRLSPSAIKSWEDGIKKPPTHFFTFVVEKDSVIVGYMELMIKDNELKKFFKIKKYGWIEAMMIAEKHRKQKVGQQLLDYAIEFFKKKKISYVRMKVFKKNTAGYSFWIKNSFEEESVEMIKKL